MIGKFQICLARVKAGPEGCKAWIKTGHLLRIEGLTRT